VAISIEDFTTRHRYYHQASDTWFEMLRRNGRDPQRAEFYVELGDALRHNAKPVDAVLCYREALRLKPDSLAGLLGLGRAFDATAISRWPSTRSRARPKHFPTTIPHGCNSGKPISGWDGKPMFCPRCGRR
jgi:hypothetical protein